VPLGDRDLGGHQRGGSALAIIHDIEQVLRLGMGQRISEPVIEDQELDPGEGVQELWVGAVGVGESGLVQEAGGALVADMEVVAAGGVGQRAGQEGLPTPVGPRIRILRCWRIHSPWASWGTSNLIASAQLVGSNVAKPNTLR